MKTITTYFLMSLIAIFSSLVSAQDDLLANSNEDGDFSEYLISQTGVWTGSSGVTIWPSNSSWYADGAVGGGGSPRTCVRVHNVETGGNYYSKYHYLNLMMDESFSSNTVYGTSVLWRKLSGLIPGATYTFSFYQKMTSVLAGKNIMFAVTDGVQANGAYTLGADGNVNTFSKQLNGIVTFNTTSSAYTQTSYTFTVPAGKTEVYAVWLRSHKTDKTTNGSMRMNIDNMSLSLQLGSPSILFTQQELDQLIQKIDTSAIGSSLRVSYNSLIQRCNSGLNFTPNIYGGTDPGTYYDQMTTQAGLVRNLALGYKLTQDTLYAQKAAAIIRSWAETCDDITYDLETGTSMLLARCNYPLICAYDLLKETSYIDTTTKNLTENWFRNLIPQFVQSVNYWDQNDYFDKQDYQNHVVAHSMGLLAMGYVLKDYETIYYALCSSTNPRNIYQLITGCIFMTGDAVHHREAPAAPAPEDGEIYDRYRHKTAPLKGLQYSHLTLTLLTISAKMCYNNGLDLFSYTSPTGEHLLLSHEYYSDYYRLMNSCIKSNFYCGETDRIGQAGDNPGMFEIGYQYYPYSNSLINLLESGSFNRGTAYMDILGYTRFYSANVDTTNLQQITASSHSEQSFLTSLSQSDRLIIYPNPAQDNLSVEPMEDIKEIIIMDLLGKTYFKVKAGSQNTINISSLNSGKYLIKCIGKKVYTCMIIKN